MPVIQQSQKMRENSKKMVVQIIYVIYIMLHVNFNIAQRYASWVLISHSHTTVIIVRRQIYFLNIPPALSAIQIAVDKGF